jgi:trehalose-phosphatase
VARPFFDSLHEDPTGLIPPAPLCLFLDFDGTLAPIRKWPEEAQISALSRSLLLELSGLEGVHVGILSGRALNDLCRKVAIPGIYYGGCHGLEMEGPGLSYQHPEVAEFRPLLSQMARELRTQSGIIPGALVEDKAFSVSLHYRNVKKEMVPFVRGVFYEVLKGYSRRIEAIPGKAVLEARPRLQWNKGDALLLLREHIGRKEGRQPFCLYLGDDQTDEDAFSALGDKGIGIRVGSEQPTAARYTLRNIKEVQRLLRWAIGLFRP